MSSDAPRTVKLARRPRTERPRLSADEVGALEFVWCGTVLRHPAALAQAAKGKVAASVGSIAIRGMVCSSLTLAGVLYPCRATSQVSL
jgi:hypothetical protein